MIQRIQTLFLVIALGSIAACFFIPFWVYTGTEYAYEVNLYAVKCVSGKAQSFYVSTLPILVIICVSSLLTLVSIFFYKNRKLQMKINNFNIFLTLIFIGTIYLWIPYMINEKIPAAIQSWQFGLFLPLLTFIVLIFANRFIRKDEKLVKSADRLR